MALDICRHDLLLPMTKTLLGIKPDNGLSVSTDFKVIITGHRVASYNRAYLVYAYDFEAVSDITNCDEVEDRNTRAFRDIDYTLEVGGADTENMLADIDLDIRPT